MAIDRSDSRPQRSGLHVARHAPVSERRFLGELACDDAEETLLACARHLALIDLVVLVDSALQLGSTSQDDLAAVAARRRRGAPLLREAVRVADRRSESVYETLLRLLHVVCEVDVEPQHMLVDRDGTHLARADLWLRGTSVIHEYDGEHHLTRPRQRKDLARSRRIGNVERLRRGYTSVDVLRHADSVFTPSGQGRLLRRLGLSETGGERRAVGA